MYVLRKIGRGLICLALPFSIALGGCSQRPQAQNLLSAKPASKTTSEDVPLEITLEHAYSGANKVDFKLKTRPTRGTVSWSGSGKVLYTPATNISGNDTFEFEVTDGSLTSSGTVNVTVLPVDDLPVALDSSLTTSEDTAIAEKARITEVDGDALTFSIVANGSKGIATFTNAAKGTFSYSPNPDAFGTDQFTFRVSDGHHDSELATVSVTITPVNDPPAMQNYSLNLAEDTPVTETLTATDVEGSPTTFSIVSNGTKGVATINDAASTFTYVPNLNATGSDSFTVRASDGQASSALATVTLNIAAVNDAPVVAASSFTTDEDTPYSGMLPATDPEGKALGYTILSSGNKGTATLTNSNTGAFTYVPTANASGTDAITFKASDGDLTSALGTVTVTLTAVNDAPVAVSSSITTNEDTAYSGTLVATDVDGPSKTFTIASGAGKGTVVLTNASTGAFSYTPNTNANGNDAFTFQVSDGQLTSNVGTISIAVSAVNDAPTAIPKSVKGFLGYADPTFQGQLGGQDVDQDALTYSLVENGLKGNVTITGSGAFTYSPSPGATGSDTFSFRVSDGHVDSATAIVSVTLLSCQTTEGEDVFSAGGTWGGVATLSDRILHGISSGPTGYIWNYPFVSPNSGPNGGSRFALNNFLPSTTPNSVSFVEADSGSLLVAGNLGDGKGVFVLRMNSDFSPVTDFALAEGETFGDFRLARPWPDKQGEVKSIAVQAKGDREIVLLGVPSLPQKPFLRRMSPQGSLLGSRVDLGVIAKKVLSITPGEIYLQDNKSLYKINNAGQYDTSFGTDGVWTPPISPGSQVQDSMLDSSGRIVVAVVKTSSGSPVGDESFLFRLLPNGALDTTFGVDGQLTVAKYVDKLGMLPDESLVAVAVNSHVIINPPSSFTPANKVTTSLVKKNGEGTAKFETVIGWYNCATTHDVSVQWIGGALRVFVNKDSTSATCVNPIYTTATSMVTPATCQ